VVVLRNYPTIGLVNGSVGTVVDFRKDEEDGCAYPVVRFSDGNEHVIRTETEKIEDTHGNVLAKREQIPLMLAWALTIHKSQGLTLEWVQVNCRGIFAHGQLYVAISRATCMIGLQILDFVRSLCKTSQCVIDFYAKLKSYIQ